MGIRLSAATFALLCLTAVIVFAAQTQWIAPESARGMESPLTDSTTSMSAGKEIFEQQCFVCHGLSGRGDGPAAKALQNQLPDFTGRQTLEQTEGELFWKISNGRAPMPTFSGTLSEEQRWQLVRYVRSFAVEE